MKKLAVVFGCVAACVLLAGLAARGAQSGAPFTSVETKDLHNAFRVTDHLISGASPHTEQAFRDLQALGVRTIVSVDGAKPDAETARRFGIRYVHLPIGYDSVKPEDGKRIAKALTELPGPVYLHCHHGKHRSAAAVAVACVMNGSLPPERAEAVLRTFGTGENYLGLWRSAREARPLDAGELAKIDVAYVEQAEIAELAERMVAVDRHWEHLKSIRKSEWRSPADHPDLDPAHEALQLEEHLRESGRAEATAARSAEFLKILQESESAAAALREALSAAFVEANAAGAAFQRVENACSSCHRSFRD